MKRLSSFGSSLAGVLLATAAWSQNDETPPAPPPAGDQPGQEAPAPKLLWNEISIGYSGLSRSGNRRKARKFATSPGGFVVRELKLTRPTDEDGQFARLTLRGIGQVDWVGEGRATFDQGRGTVQLGFDEAEYFDSTPFVVGPSQEDSTRAGLRYAFTRDFGAFLDYRTRARTKRYEGPKPILQDRTTALAGGIQGKAPGGNFSLTFGDDRYFDRTGAQPNTTLRRYDARYGLDFGGGPFSLEGFYTRTNIEQIGRQNGHLIAAGLNADWDAGPSTAISANLRREDLNIPVNSTVTVRRKLFTGARLVQRLGRRTTFQFGFKRTEIERVRADRTFVDTPAWNTYDAKLATRLSDSLRLSLRGSLTTMDGQLVVTSTTDNRRLVWDDRARVEARLDGGNERINGYVGYAFQFKQNSPRDVEVSGHGITLGASLGLGERSTAYFEFAGESQRATGVAQDGLSLDDFFPSDSVIALGFDHQFRPGSSLSVGLTQSYTNNANPLGLRDENVRQTFVTARYRHQVTQASELEVVLAPWRSKDRAIEQMDYRSTTFGLFYTTKF